MRIFAQLIIVLLFTETTFGQLSIDFENHQYIVSDLDNYQENITIEGRNSSFSEETIGFLVNEMAELESYQLYERKGSKWKPSKLKKEVTISSIDRSSFFSGTQYYYFPIPSGMEFKLECSTTEKHTVFLTKLYRSGWFDADFVNYQFELPENLMLTSRGGDTFRGSFHVTDKIYQEKDEMPYLIHPIDEEPITYFSKWFEERITPQLTIDPSLIPKDLTKIAETGTRLELAKACFRFVQTQIKYIDIENGINAIIPRQCEKVLKNGLGDCKDMATLLTALYRHFGFEAYSAISRTNDKEDVFDFPSLSLANHTICALKFSDEWYFLDATEDACLFGDASIQTLGSEVFLVGFEGDPFLKVDENPRSDSKANLFYRLDDDMRLTLRMRVSGKMNLFLYHAKLKQLDPHESIKSVLDQISGLKWDIDSSSIIDSVSIIHASVRLGSSMYSKMGSKTLYNLEFLPSPQMMTALFQNSRYPLFDGKVSLGLNLGGKIKSALDYQPDVNLMMIGINNQLNIDCTLQKETDSSSFAKSSLVSAWKKFIQQPLLIDYED